MLVKVPSLDGIGECAALEDLALFEMKARNLLALRGLNRLRKLHLNELRRLTSVEGIEGLPIEDAELRYLSRLQSIAPLAELPRLKKLEVIRAKNVKDIERLGEIQPLEDLLLLSGAPLPSVDFLASLTNLDRLWLHDAKRDSPLSLAPLRQMERLRILGLFDMRQAVDVEKLGNLVGLRHLTIERGPELASLEFMRGLRNLREFCLRRTRVADGDFSVLLDLPNLKHIYEIRPQLEHYSHTADELNALLAARDADSRTGDDTN